MLKAQAGLGFGRAEAGGKGARICLRCQCCPGTRRWAGGDRLAAGRPLLSSCVSLRPQFPSTDPTGLTPQPPAPWRGANSAHLTELGGSAPCEQGLAGSAPYKCGLAGSEPYQRGLTGCVPYKYGVTGRGNAPHDRGEGDTRRAPRRNISPCLAYRGKPRGELTASLAWEGKKIIIIKRKERRDKLNKRQEERGTGARGRAQLHTARGAGPSPDPSPDPSPRPLPGAHLSGRSPHPRVSAPPPATAEGRGKGKGRGRGREREGEGGREGWRGARR